MIQGHTLGIAKLKGGKLSCQMQQDTTAQNELRFTAMIGTPKAMQEAGYKVTIASPAGGKIPIDENSLQGDFKTPITAKWLDDGMLF